MQVRGGFEERVSQGADGHPPREDTHKRTEGNDKSRQHNSSYYFPHIQPLNSIDFSLKMTELHPKIHQFRGRLLLHSSLAYVPFGADSKREWALQKASGKAGISSVYSIHDAYDYEI